MATEVDEALYDALEAGDPDAVRRALAAGADPDGVLTSQRCATSPVSTLDWQMQVGTPSK